MSNMLYDWSEVDDMDEDREVLLNEFKA